jgi:hypothetical protein
MGSIGSVDIPGVTKADSSGGWDVQERTVDRSDNYQTFNQRRPVEITFEAWVKQDTYESLRDLRDGDPEAIGVSLGTYELPEAQLMDIQITQEAQSRSHLRVSGSVKEVFFAGVESSEIVVETEPADAGGGEPSVASGGGDDSPPGLVGDTGDDTGTTESRSRASQMAEMRQATPGPWI